LDYDRETGKLYWKNGPMKGREAGWFDNYGYRLTRLDGPLVRNHHIVWFMETGEWPEFELDHINNEPSDNRFCNLRPATRKNQGENQKLQKRREGKWKGVHVSSSGKYYVKIKHNQKNVTGLPGNLTCAREAAMIYNIKAEELFGPFANFNQVFEDVEVDDERSE
jgi:hypothetical protein